MPRLSASLRGWSVVLGCGIANFCSFCGNTFGVAFFIPFLRAELQLSHFEMALVWGGGVSLAAVAIPHAGRFIDARGPRRALAYTVLPLCASVGGMGSVRSWPALLLLLATMRFFGIGLIYVATTKAVNTWFVRKRGRASVVITAMFYAMMALPPAAHALIEARGWRGAYRALALLTGAGMLVALALIRDSPARCGLLADGDGSAGSARSSAAPPAAAAVAADATATAGATAFTLAQARTSPAFWLMTLAVWVVEVQWTGFNFNILLLLGPSSATAQLSNHGVLVVLSVCSVASAACSCASGAAVEWLQRRRRARRLPHRHGLLRLIALQMALASASSAMLPRVSSLGSAIAFALPFSAMIGIQDIVLLTGYAEVFGHAHLGAIVGWVMAAMTAATAAGPALTALAVEAGRPALLFVPLAALSALIGALCCVVPDPAPKSATAPAAIAPSAGTGIALAESSSSVAAV
jgi:MFS family permease